jgi:hypothetical protein
MLGTGALSSRGTGTGLPGVWSRSQDPLCDGGALSGHYRASGTQDQPTSDYLLTDPT